jgi:predicted transposase YdaD
MMRYDVASKVTVEIARYSIVELLFGIRPSHVSLIERLPQESVSLRRSDFPLMVEMEDERFILLLEFQTRWEREIPLRLLEYMARLKMEYELRVVPAVMLFMPSRVASDEYEDEHIRFRFRLLRMWEMDGREVYERGEVRLYPFLPVMRGGEDVLREAEEEIYRSDLSVSEKADLLTAMAIFAGLRSREMAMELVRRRRDIMIQSAAYEIIKEEGIREGIKQGIQQGLQQGLQEGLREAIESLLKVKFGVEGTKLMEKLNEDASIQKLRAVKSAIEVAKSIREVEQMLEG